MGSKALVVAGNIIPILRTNSLTAMTIVQFLVYFSNYFYIMTLFHPILELILMFFSKILSERIK